jgi:hypothetical protein
MTARLRGRNLPEQKKFSVVGNPNRLRAFLAFGGVRADGAFASLVLCTLVVVDSI